MKIIIAAAFVLFSLPLSGASLVGRVLDATPTSLRVQVATSTADYPLAGIAEIAGISSEWRTRIASRLQRELVGKFVMLEADGTAYQAFRSPDALPVNRWLITEGLASVSCACPELQRDETRARLTGQGWWSTGNSISSSTLADYEYLGVTNPAAPSSRTSASRAPNAQPKAPKAKAKSTGRGRKK